MHIHTRQYGYGYRSFETAQMNLQNITLSEVAKDKENNNNACSHFQVEFTEVEHTDAENGGHQGLKPWWLSRQQPEDTKFHSDRGDG